MAQSTLTALVGDAIADAAERLGVGPESIEVFDAREVTWRDSSIGCPQPGTMYLQRLTPGYLIVVGSAGRRLEYHAGPLGPARLCADPRSPVPEGGIGRDGGPGDDQSGFGPI